jgi:hypothetical protein
MVETIKCDDDTFKELQRQKNALMDDMVELV